MGGTDGRAAHIMRIQESAHAVQAAAAAWEKARDIENKAKAARLAEGVKHREAIAKFQQELVDGWKAGVEIPKLLEVSGLSKPRLYQLIQKLEHQES